MATNPINSTSSQPGVANAVNSAIRDIQSMQVVQVFKDDTGTRRVILDKDGLRTSSEGKDVVGADNSDLTFNSNNNVFKIVLSGTAEATIPDPLPAGTTVTTTIPHGLDFPPSFLCFVETAAGGSSYLNEGDLTTVPTSLIPTAGGSAGLTVVYVGASVDDTNLYLKVSNTFGAGISGLGTPWTFRYYILQETAATS